MDQKFNISSVLSERAAHNGLISSVRKGGGSKKVFLSVIAILVALPLLQLTGGNYNYLLHMGLFTFMYVAMSSSWNILGGYAGYVSLGHNVFFCIGAYFSGMLLVKLGYPVILTAPLAGLVATIFGFFIGFIMLRVKGPAFIISSIALLMVARILFDNWDYIGGSNGITMPLMQLPVEFVKIPYYYAMLTLAILTLVVSYHIKHSKFGLGLRAISQDEVKAECAGINIRFYKVSAFAISAFFVGVAGAIWGDYMTYLRPNIFLIILVAANMVLMCILGGKGTVAGPVVGTVFLIAFNEFFVSQFGASEINILGTGLIMIVTLLYFPNGVVGTLRKKGKLPRFLDWD